MEKKRKLLSPYPAVLFGVYLAAWIVLAVGVNNREDWLLENVLVFLGIPAAIWGYRNGIISDLSLALIMVFIFFHSIGAHYTYSEVPAGRIVSGFFHWQRNCYDRFVHFLFGLFLTLPVLELLRVRVQATRGWLYFILFCIIATAGICYELIEWGAAAVFGKGTGEAYVGAQGDIWDAQKDVSLKLIGCLVAMVVIFIYEKRHTVHRLDSFIGNRA